MTASDEATEVTATLTCPVTPNWEVYRPPAQCFLGSSTGLHGLGHLARVLVWANQLALHMQEDGIEVDREAVRWAATLHDVRRIADGPEPEHGTRCSSWLQNRDFEPLIGVSSNRLARIAYCCYWHVPRDDMAPSMTPELICLKDADALDRVRLNGPDVRQLRTGFARQMLGQARFLCDTSRVLQTTLNDPWLAVRTTATNVGLWSTESPASTLELAHRLRYFIT